jgi:hypothetical protein
MVSAIALTLPALLRKSRRVDDGAGFGVGMFYPLMESAAA